MIKKLLLALWIIVLMQATSYAEDQYNYFGFFLKQNNPSRDFIGNINEKIPNEIGGGVSFNSFSFEIAPFFEGQRSVLSYYFQKKAPVRPYIGISYVVGTGDIYDTKTKRYLRGYDGLIGISFEKIPLVKLYADYSITTAYFMYGVRIELKMKSLKNY